MEDLRHMADGMRRERDDEEKGSDVRRIGLAIGFDEDDEIVLWALKMDEGDFGGAIKVATFEGPDEAELMVLLIDALGRSDSKVSMQEVEL